MSCHLWRSFRRVCGGKISSIFNIGEVRLAGSRFTARWWFMRKHGRPLNFAVAYADVVCGLEFRCQLRPKDQQLKRVKLGGTSRSMPFSVFLKYGHFRTLTITSFTWGRSVNPTNYLDNFSFNCFIYFSSFCDLYSHCLIAYVLLYICV